MFVNKLRNGLFIILICALFIPLIQNTLSLFEVKRLSGDFNPAPDVWFRLNDWFNGNYQEGKEKYLNDNFGFHNTLIRTHNQLNFELFRKAQANGVIVGKEDYLYEENYIKTYYGEDFIGVDSITRQMKRLKFVQDTMAKLNKTLLLVFAASKGSYYPEYFPDYMKVEKGPTNYEYFLKLANELGLNYIDFDKYFVDNKLKSKYPLYPRHGIHWSHYGECLVTDSIVRYIEKKQNIRMPHLFWNKIDMHVPDPWTADMDIAFGMNLYCPLPEDALAYPELQYEDANGKTKPSVIGITDSFYWRIFALGYGRIFSNSQFWFYNSAIYMDTTYQNPKLVSDINLRDEIQNNDIIILMSTEPNLKELGWGFIEQAYKMFKTKPVSTFAMQVDSVMNDIRATKDWYKLVVAKAAKEGIPIDTAIKRDAIWVMEQHNKK